MFYLRIIILASVAAFISAGARAQQCFCLKSTGLKKGFTMQMTLSGEEWKHGTVQYGVTAERIPIVLRSSKEKERLNGRPSYFLYTWDEMYKGKKSGTYVLGIQGANVYDAYYIRDKDKKKFRLERIISEEECSGCLQK